MATKTWTKELIDKGIKDSCQLILGVELERITDSATIDDELGADSLDRVELIMEIEETFEIGIPEEDCEKFNTIGDIRNYLEGKLLKVTK